MDKNLNAIYIKQAPHAIAMFDREMRYIAVSEKWLNDYGITEAVIGKTHYEVFPEIGDDWKKIHLDCLAGATNTNPEAIFERLDGSRQWISWDVRPWHDQKGEIGGILMYTEDITRRKLVEIKLSQSEQQFRQTFEHAAIGMAIVGMDGRWIKVNRGLSKIIGYTEEELLSKTFQDITHPEDLNKDLKLLSELLEGKRQSYQLEKRYFHKTGREIWILLSVAMVKDPEGKPLHFVAQITDISEQKNAGQRLQDVLAELKSILNASSHVSIIATDVNGLITTFNKGAENLLGYEAEEMVFKENPSVIHVPEEVEARAKELSEKFNEPIAGFETFVAYAKRGEYESRQWTYVRKDGSTFPVQLVVTARNNIKGEITGYLGVAIDISKIKEAEKEIKSLLDVASDQNNRLLNFAHIVSHNLRSHSSNLTMLLELIDSEEEEAAKQEMISLLHEASSNLRETINHLNEVVIINTSLKENLKPISLKKSVDSAIGNIHALLKNHRGTFIVDIHGDVNILAVPAYLDSILLNFITNSIKYRSPERNPVIKIAAVRVDSYIELSIEDNGLGIDLKRHGSKLFGMYKTFHGNTDARGIGLFITKNQVEAMGGKIDVESEPGIGTTFKIYLKQ
jgi:PAS domain S-box-containing protein